MSISEHDVVCSNKTNSIAYTKPSMACSKIVSCFNARAARPLYMILDGNKSDCPGNVLEWNIKAQRSHDGRWWGGAKAGDRFVSFVLSNSATQQIGDPRRRRGPHSWERDATTRFGARTAGSHMQIARWYVRFFFLILYFSVTVRTDFERHRKKNPENTKNRFNLKPHTLDGIQKKTESFS